MDNPPASHRVATDYHATLSRSVYLPLLRKQSFRKPPANPYQAFFTSSSTNSAEDRKQDLFATSRVLENGPARFCPPIELMSGTHNIAYHRVAPYTTRLQEYKLYNRVKYRLRCIFFMKPQ